MKSFAEINAEWDAISESRGRAIARGDAYGTDASISFLARDVEMLRMFTKEILAELAEREKERTP